MKDQKELRGGSLHWWPPRQDLVVLYKANPLRFDYFDRYVRNWSGLKVLDVGCGGGYACEYLARRQAVVAGTDILEAALLEARAHAAQQDLQIDYRLSAAERLDCDDDAMDAVTCFDVLEHIPDKQTALREIYRVLKPGGWLFFDTLNKTFRSRLLIIWLGEIITRLIPRGTHDWRYFITPSDLRRCLEAQGFVRVEFAGIRLGWRQRAEGGLPAKILPEGGTAIIYFGAARKPTR